jgi:hypothetical protein
MNGKSKILIYMGISFALLLALYLTINYNWHTFNNQPVLSNKRYPLVLDSIRLVKKRLYKNKASTAILEKKFISMMCTGIFPYWYGTKWNFHGTTEKPNEGNIACGYFVTTTLRDIGVPINRIKMAQCASEEMIRNLTGKKNIHHLSNIQITDFEERIKKFGNGLYIVGLDNHTGFILISSEGNYFIHSSGVFPYQVVKDKLAESPLLVNSTYRVVGKISADETFLKKWIAYNK